MPGKGYGMVDQCELELPTGRVRVRVPPGGAGVMSAFKDLQQPPLEGLDAPYLHAGDLLAAAGGVTARTDQASHAGATTRGP